MILFAYKVKEKMLDLNSILTVYIFLTRIVKSSCSLLQEDHIEVFMKKG